MAVWPGAMEDLVTTSDALPGLPSAQFWRGKRVLLTGHTGFKGGWLAIWLRRLGADVTGIALSPNTKPSLFETARVFEMVKSHFCDIRDAESVSRRIREANPEVVLHLAAQPLVRASYREPVETFSSNVMGTAHLLDALRDLERVSVALMVTTDKVYREREWVYPYREEDALGGHDPYSASKAAAEIVVASYRDAFLSGQGVAVATARSGNVIGGGDWSEDRLIPDAVRAWSAGQPLCIRRPNATRPWQHVLEPLAAYLVLAERLWGDASLAGAWNFGPATHESATVRQVVESARHRFGKGEVVWGDGTDGPHEAAWLALETAKARHALGVSPRWHLEESITRTMNWYRRMAEGEAPRNLCEEDIDAYEASG